MNSRFNLRPSIFGKFLALTFLPLVGSFCAGLFGRKIGLLGSSNATITCFVCAALLLCVSFMFFIWRLCETKKADCKLLLLFAPSNTQKITGAVFALFYLLGYFFETGMHILFAIISRRFSRVLSRVLLKIFLKSVFITSLLFWFQSSMIYIYSAYPLFFDPYFSYVQVKTHVYLEKSFNLFLSFCGLILALIQSQPEIGYLYSEVTNNVSPQKSTFSLKNQFTVDNLGIQDLGNEDLRNEDIGIQDLGIQESN